MSAEFFVDTNVFVYHLDNTDRRKQGVAERIVRDGLATGNACISYQVVQECLNVALRKAEVALPVDAARSYLDAVLLPLMQVTASESLYHRALDVQARWRYGFHDSLIVASALAAGCRTLLSEDLQHGQRLEGLTIVDPFR
ncbi:MAG: PIN domain-containing protein [Rubrivivax sp.]|nr:PIN domain-containing protein [Rubrivivax sp.]